MKKKGVARVLSLLPAIESVVTFILTEDMTQDMQLVDKWTILMVAFLAVNGILAVLSKKRKKDEDDDQSGQNGSQTANA